VDQEVQQIQKAEEDQEKEEKGLKRLKSINWNLRSKSMDAQSFTGSPMIQ